MGSHGACAASLLLLFMFSIRDGGKHQQKVTASNSPAAPAARAGDPLPAPRYQPTAPTRTSAVAQRLTEKFARLHRVRGAQPRQPAPRPGTRGSPPAKHRPCGKARCPPRPASRRRAAPARSPAGRCPCPARSTGPAPARRHPRFPKVSAVPPPARPGGGTAPRPRLRSAAAPVRRSAGAALPAAAPGSRPAPFGAATGRASAAGSPGRKTAAPG